MVAATTLLAVLTVQAVNYVTGLWGCNLAARLTLSTVGGLAAGALVFILLVRYRLKTSPLSIP